MSELLYVLDARSEPHASESQGNCDTHYCANRANHPAMTYASKTDWHKPYGITHTAWQLAASG